MVTFSPACIARFPGRTIKKPRRNKKKNPAKEYNPSSCECPSHISITDKANKTMKRISNIFASFLPRV